MKKTKLDTGFGSLQWFIFLIANSLTIPIIVGQVFQLSPLEISGLMQRTFLVVGVSSLLSGWLGHRLPIPDGPAGIWLGVFTLMGQMAVVQGIDKAGGSLQLLEGAMLLTGIILIIVGLTGWMNKLLKLFTPLVNGVYLTILGFQLSGMFLKGMIGGSDKSTKIQPGIVILSFAIFILVLALSVWGKGWLKSYAVLIGMVVGSIAFILFFGSQPMPKTSSIISLPDVFAWGMPKLDAGMFVSSIMVTFVLISSIIASVAAMKQVFSEKANESTPALEMRKEGSLKSSGIISGIGTILSSVFSTVGVVPFSVAAGFVRMTGQSRMLPFYIASISLAAISFFPKVYSLFAMLPGPIAYAAMLASFTSMAGIGISSVLKEPLDQRRLTILSTALSLGTGVMFLPQAVFSALPTVLQYVFSNGVMVGMLVALIFEQIWRPKKVEMKIKNKDNEIAV
ncbi:purine/pyrimidine permease [Neobacillus novalis]|uniref:Purine/pyrimidine permease n=1 Tax=Neobacillus novalis TaxID=220687 RepID=A0AA95S9C2_9BACI|nr:purine/pyrimidine permease [Neobacillus novalis]WHY86820.1 purine/pyrimidine permease [Neobacillus novalis]